MPSKAEDIAIVREDMLKLLSLQMDALGSPLGLTDCQIKECCDRQARVLQMREKIESLRESEIDQQGPPGDSSGVLFAGSGANA